ncbi:Transcriptional regulator TetR [Desulfovibrio sp. X2]|uniref:CerR family C-terminal domain-containing protein n=1 Tax=Desulfovibrio sp. X2 TaxID=941449 RepID=UPI00035888C6|nr:CerR family C-terminal domain-containing protein [Desulfovibrio sp. X2]EPR42109.1 Transcriptional regulator TetR [Desulfovibrio sp. X2]
MSAANGTEKTTDTRLTKGLRTRNRLLEEALRLFALRGPDAVGIREVAAAAKANPASIAFHFGGKEGLYAAVVERMVEELSRVHRAALDEATAASDAAGEDAPARVRRLVAGLTSGYLTSKRSQWMTLLLQREFISPTAAFEKIYAGALAPTLEVLSRLAGETTGRARGAQESKILAFSLFIMGSAFSRNRNTFLRFSGKDAYAAEDVELISRTVAEFAASGLSSHL